MSQIPEIQISDLKAKLGSVKLIDVRRPDEFTGDLGHIQGAQLVTLETDLEQTLPRLPKDQTYVFVCRSGGRSARATQMAQACGLKNVFNMTGGMLAWNEAGFPIER